MQASLALVHHANQYLITDGYENREGLLAVVGNKGDSGLACVLELHQRYQVPLNLHISGTLLEAIAWHQPGFLPQLRAMIAGGLIELVGSCYGQNIMRFFGPEYNRKQLNEELLLYQAQLGVEPAKVKTFWPPERVWETRRMAPALRDASLLNGGYRYVILDDRLLLSPKDPQCPREYYDRTGSWIPELFQMHEIESGLGLIAFPIATRLRRSIPPGQDEDWKQVQRELESLCVQSWDADEASFLAVYGDDMEKAAGVGEWGTEGPERYESFLEWLRQSRWVQPVLLAAWAAEARVGDRRKIETGTFQELARDFQAGEGYENWYLAPDWQPYRDAFTWAESKVRELVDAGADPALIALAEKQLLVSNWETAWHTPPSGPHGDPDQHGHASPWARALTSHGRHAAVTAAAAWWMRHKDGKAHASLEDVDNDGELELVLKNSCIFAVLTPRWGGRLVFLFGVAGERGALVIGNPCDDWNWMEELNRYMDVPRNHPGALADVGFEHDAYDAQLIAPEGDRVCVVLCNRQQDSAAFGMTKTVHLREPDAALNVHYSLPPELTEIDVEFGLSPDYLSLLRHGSHSLSPYLFRGARGFSNDTVTVWVKPHPGQGLRWKKPYQERFGHGCAMRLGTRAREFDLETGVTLSRPPGARPRRWQRTEAIL